MDRIYDAFENIKRFLSLSFVKRRFTIYFIAFLFSEYKETVPGPLRRSHGLFNERLCQHHEDAHVGS